MHNTRKVLRRNLSNVKIDDIIQRKRLSPLFENGPGERTHGLFNPYVDYSAYLANKKNIQKELIKRQANNDLKKLETLWRIYHGLKNKKSQLQLELNKVIPKKEKQLNIPANLIKEELKKIDDQLYPAEENAVVEYLKLPNTLHHLTPEKEYTILYEYQSKTINNKNHLIIAKEHNLLQFTEENRYYLKNDGAIFELGAQIYFSHILKEYEFTQYSNTDFCKSYIVEGCGEDYSNPNVSFILKNTSNDQSKQLHLIGGGSIYSFFCRYIKSTVFKKHLPLKFYTMGRKYEPSKSHENSLFNANQSSVIDIFVVHENLENVDNYMKKLIEMIKASYETLGYHYRLCYVPATMLKGWESLRLSIEMYSSSQKKYLEIGNVSLSGDYICKRLMCTYLNKANDRELQFPYIITGTILNVPRFLGCILEQDQVFKVPCQFREHSWKSYNVPVYSG